MKHTTIDEQEVENFSALADQWWDETGPFKPLHDLTPARLTYLKEQICAHFSKDIQAPDALKGLLKSADKFALLNMLNGRA